MATVYENAPTASGSQAPGKDGPGYDGYVEVDTTVPPKARPVLNRISVNGVAIAEADILSEAQNHPADTPGAAVLAAARALVVRELLLQQARAREIEGTPAADGDGRHEAPDDAAIRCLVEAEVTAPTASEEECRRFYDNNPDRFRSEPIFEARHILVAAAPDDPSARKRAREEAGQIIAHLNERPSDFADLARRVSACPSRDQGGSLGQITHGSTVPEFERALESLREGQLSPQPVESRYGIHVVRLDRKIDGQLLPFDLVRERIAAWLDAAAWSKAVAQYIAVLAGKADIAGIDIAAADGPLIQ